MKVTRLPKPHKIPMVSASSPATLVSRDMRLGWLKLGAGDLKSALAGQMQACERRVNHRGGGRNIYAARVRDGRVVYSGK